MLSVFALMAVLIGFAQAAPSAATTDAANGNDNGSGSATVYTIVEGQVVDELGRGIAAADVEVIKIADDKVRGQASSDQFGDFKIKLEGEHPGQFKIIFKKGDFKEQEIEFEIEADDLEPFVDATLLGSLRVTGKVVDVVEEQPVKGAEVRFKSDYRSSTATTGESGEFAFEDLLAGRSTIIVSADGFGKSQTRVTITARPAPAPAPLRIILMPQRVLKLTIVDDQDKPIAGAAVELEMIPGPDYRSASSGDDGTISIEQLPYDSTKAMVRLTHRDYVASGLYDRAVDFEAERLETQATLRMSPAASISGKVVDAATGRAVNGARVDVGHILTGLNPHTFCNLAGEFGLGSLPPGETVVTVHAVGFAPQLKDVRTAPANSAVVAFELVKGRTVSGVVLDLDGEPVKRADVFAVGWRTHQTLGLADRSGALGRFTIENAPDDAFLVDVVADGFAPLKEQLISAERHEYEFKFESVATAPAGGGFGSLASVKPGDDCPAFEMTTLQGAKLDNGSIKGKLTLLDFWATWCGPCLAEIPALKRIWAEFGRRDDFLLIGISGDFDKGSLRKFLRSKEISWHQVFESEGGGAKLAQALGVQAIPFTLLLGPDGKVISVGASGELLHAEIAKRLKPE